MLICTKCGKTIKTEDFQGKACVMFNKGVPPRPSQFGKSRLLAEITKPRHTRISLSILVVVWKMNYDSAEFCSWVCLWKTHRCCLQHKTRKRKTGQGWAVPTKIERLSAACQEDSSSFIFFSAAILLGGLLGPRQAALIGGYTYGLLLAEGHTAWSPPWDLPVKPWFAGRSLTSSIIQVKTSLSFDVNSKPSRCILPWLSLFPSW